MTKDVKGFLMVFCNVVLIGCFGLGVIGSVLAVRLEAPPIFTDLSDSNQLVELNSYLQKMQAKINDSLELASDEAVYFGDRNTNGSWRIIRSGNNLLIQRLETSVWTTKDTITP